MIRAGGNSWVLACCDRRTTLGRRDFAIILILPRLGLRRSEGAAVTLDDLGWRAGDVTIHGKGGRTDRLPLPADVCAATAGHLRRGRPPAHRGALSTYLGHVVAAPNTPRSNGPARTARSCDICRPTVDAHPVRAPPHHASLRKTIHCGRCGEQRPNVEHGLCSRCSQADPDRPFRYAASLAQRMAPAPQWWNPLVEFTTARYYPGGAVVILRETVRLLGGSTLNRCQG